jgi:hypothetical protein
MGTVLEIKRITVASSRIDNERPSSNQLKALQQIRHNRMACAYNPEARPAAA